MKGSFTLAWFTVTVVVFATMAFAQEHDTRIARDAERALGGITQLTIFDDVSAEVREGYVRLAGCVTLPQKRVDAEKRVAAIAGVRGIRNDIAVLPVSESDDALRLRLARAIYGNPAFWRYASMAQPPIHIIVEHGRVTLRGSVGSNTDRMLAQSLATGVGEGSVSNELRTHSEAAARRRP